MHICKYAGNVRQNSSNNFFLQKQKRRKIQIKLIFFPNCSCWHVQCMFWLPCKKVSHKLRKIPLLLGKSRRHIESSSEKAWLKKFALTLKNSRLKTKVNFWYYTFFQNLLFVGKFLWYVRCSFGNSSKDFWVKTTENFLTNSKNGYSTEISTKTNHASNWSSGLVKEGSRSLQKKCRQKVRKCVAQGLKVAI